jgi:pyruvate dehydrogenase complex dehydrogenase (E1) component
LAIHRIDGQPVWHYQARFNYLEDRGKSGYRLESVGISGDGETDEPGWELSPGLAGKTGQFIFVINCNLHGWTVLCGETARSFRNWKRRFAAPAGM